MERRGRIESKLTSSALVMEEAMEGVGRRKRLWAMRGAMGSV